MREIANWVKMEWFALGKIWNFVFFLEKKHQISQNQFVIIKLFAPKAVPSFKMKRSLTEYDSKEQNLDRLKRQKTSTCSSHFFWCCSWFLLQRFASSLPGFNGLFHAASIHDYVFENHIAAWYVCPVPSHWAHLHAPVASWWFWFELLASQLNGVILELRDYS